jgi:hypothetical protein
MNLTKLFVAGLCFTAMTASAGFLGATNDFEGGVLNGTWSGGVTALNITNMATGVADENTPIIGTGDTQVLRLNTDGAVWTNEIGRIFANAGDTLQVFADMLVKFVPSESLPSTNSLSGKMAIAVKADVGGTNRLNISWANSSGFQDWLEISSKVISTTTWHRVTVRMYTIDAGETPKATVYLDGDSVLDQGITGNTLVAIGFQGTGFIDELAVHDSNPFGGGAVQITLSFVTGIASVYVGPTQKLDTETVDSGSDLIITAAQWKEISDVSGSGVTTNWISGSPGDSVVTVKVTATSSATVTVTAVTESSTAETSGSGTSFDGAAMNKVAAWALANGVTTLTSGIYTNYLYNIDDAATVPELLIKSIAVTGTTVTVTVGAGTNNLSILNGVLKLKAWQVLGGTPVTYTNEVPIAGTTNVTVQVDISTNKFVKALIE